ncbi:MAG: hypothetical protein Q4F24_13415, partial [Eubacteriales bacterium]|nr:hypothetical protein [Eubacteriales bacterium]
TPEETEAPASEEAETPESKESEAPAADDEDTANELPDQNNQDESEKESEIEENQEEEALKEDTAHEEEAVGASVNSSVKKIAGSKPLVGQEIADNGYKGSTEKPSVDTSNTNTGNTQTTTPSVNTQTTAGASSNVPTSTPSAYAADSNVSSNNNITSTTKTRRFGVVTGDTTNIFPYALSGALAAMIAMLTAVTMRSRKKTSSDTKKDE